MPINTFARTIRLIEHIQRSKVTFLFLTEYPNSERKINENTVKNKTIRIDGRGKIEQFQNTAQQ